MGKLLAQLKLFGVCAFYLGANFTVFAIPALMYLAWHGSRLSQGLVLLTVIDFCIPLRPGGKGQWLWWCKFTSMADGIVAYFDGECIVEGEYRRDTNYLLIYEPHGLFGIGLNLWTKHLYDKYGIIGMFTAADIVFQLPLLRRLSEHRDPNETRCHAPHALPECRRHADCRCHARSGLVGRKPRLRGPAQEEPGAPLPAQRGDAAARRCG